MKITGRPLTKLPLIRSACHRRSATAAPREMKRETLVIGDIHGEIAALNALLAAARPRRETRIACVGDLVDYGPDSGAVIERVKGFWQDHDDVRVVQGNHDRKIFNVFDATRKGDTARLQKISIFPEVKETLERLSEAQKEWLGTLPTVEPFGPWLMVHAGITPKIRMSREEFVQRSKTHLGGDLRTVAYLNPRTHSLIKFEMNKPTVHGVFWAEIYDGRYGHVLFGHQVHRAVTRYSHALALDTGSGWGRWLSAVQISKEEKVEKVISIHTRENTIRESEPANPSRQCRIDFEELKRFNRKAD